MILSIPRRSRSGFKANCNTRRYRVDPVVTGQLPSAKRQQAAEVEPTGINFVELLKRKKDDDKGSQE